MLLFLDDFQLIEEAVVRDAVMFLLDHLPAKMHLVIASRSDPLLPMARLRAGGDLTEVRAADLRFTSDEAAGFLTRAMGLALTGAQVVALETRTEGWIAGLQLAAVSIRGASDVPEFISAFAGSNRFVVDYLLEEVLRGRPDSIRDFLAQTSILDRLSGSLCDAVTGRSDSAEMLESLDRANLFIVPLDDRREWFRYHHLFADVLRARLLGDRGEPAAILHRRASGWYEANNLPVEAVRHAFDAADFARAATLVEATIPGVRKSRHDATLLRWLGMLPDDTIKRRPVLSVFSAWSSLVSGDLAAVERHLANAEQLLAASGDGTSTTHDSEPGEELDSLPVTISLYRASVALATGNLDRVAQQAQLALDRSKPDDHLGRGAAAGLLGLAAWARGDLESGVTAFGESAASLRNAGNLTDALSTTMVLGDMLLPLGRLRATERAYEDSLRQAIEYGNGGQPTADLHAGLSEVLLERNEIRQAKEHLAASDALGDGAFSHEHRYRWFVAMAGVHGAEGNHDLALAALAEAEAHYRRGFFPEVRPVSGLRARVWIAQGRLAEAMAWVQGAGLTVDDELTYLREFGHITLARLLIADREAGTVAASVDKAERLLDRLLDAADKGGRTGSANEILVLQALAVHAQGRTASALVPLSRALDQAEAEGYCRLLLNEGAPMLDLLRSAAGAGINPDFVRRLSQALRPAGDTFSVSQPADALSARELHVLRLLATSLTGPEIARELYVSLNTMRTHTKHIFAKLEVTSRPAAVRRAESLGLI